MRIFETMIMQLIGWSLLLPVLMAVFFRVKRRASRWVLGVGLGVQASMASGLAPRLARLLDEPLGREWSLTIEAAFGAIAAVLLLVGVLLPQPPPREDDPVPARQFPMEPGRERSYWALIGLSIVTLGVWWWVHFFMTTGELRRKMRTRGQDQAARDAGAWLVLLLVVSVIGAVGSTLSVALHKPFDTRWAIDDHFYGVLAPVAQSSVFMTFALGMFWCLYMQAVAAAREASGLPREGRVAFGLLLGFSLPLHVAMSILNCWPDMLVWSAVAGLVLLPLALTLLYVVVSAANRVWTEVPVLDPAIPCAQLRPGEAPAQWPRYPAPPSPRS